MYLLLTTSYYINMNIKMEVTIGNQYHSLQQQARVITENWATLNLYCPICGAPHIEALRNNKPVADLQCSYFADSKIISRGWLMDVLFCLESLGKKKFSLDDVYGFIKYLQERHQKNHNIKAKIRQQLQLLRDKGYVKFLGNGEYITKN